MQNANLKVTIKNEELVTLNFTLSFCILRFEI